ncbi:hypothetical protein Ocin01_09645 [Orchesella cincta]|uniref:Band 7 domain-containing protein n=1 Tax=Orchesella cincta TaxID=48709 RepID=A0A1D2MVC1_ORCCI|nr:hypothetical protein Ocin01_09645 [Orchesella cincta]
MMHPDEGAQSTRSVAGTAHPVQQGHGHQNMAKVAPSYAQTMTSTNSPTSYSFVESIAICMSWILVVIFYPIAVFKCHFVVREYQRAVLFRLGKIDGGPKGPGTFFILPCVDDFRVLDLRTVSFDVPPQAVLTKDSVTVQVDAVVFYRIASPILAVTNVANYNSSTQFLASTMLRNTLGTRMLADLLADRPGVSNTMKDTLDEATDAWGIKVERVEIKDIRLPELLQRSMAAEGEATRIAKAKLTSAEGEIKASQALKEASNILNSSEGALKLRHLQMIAQVGAVNNNTIIVPIGFMNSK